MTRIKLSIEPRFLRIPTQWEIDQLGPELIAVPSFPENVEKTNLVQVDAWELRNRFLQMKNDEESAISFLHEVGVWKITSIGKATGSALEITGAFGARLVLGWTPPVCLSQMWKLQRGYRELLADPAKMRRNFGPPPRATAARIDKEIFAERTTYQNTLPVHIEWRGGHPIAVVEVITWHEMMVTTVQLDLLQGARFRYCRRPDCHIPFPVTTAQRKIYCSWYCGHIEATRRSRKGKGRKGKE